jgi:hypothetical protein
MHGVQSYEVSGVELLILLKMGSSVDSKSFEKHPYIYEPGEQLLQ